MGMVPIIISIVDAIVAKILTRIFHQTWKMHPKIILETELKFDKMIFPQDKGGGSRRKKETEKKEGKKQIKRKKYSFHQLSRISTRLSKLKENTDSG